MFEFKSPALEDRNWVQPLLEKSGYMGCENSFGTLYIWSEAYSTKICRYKDFFLRCSGKDQPYYGFPIGESDPYPVIEELIADAKEKGKSFKMIGVTQDIARELEVAMPGRFVFKADRNNADYIYSTENLIKLAGRKYHGKRNHIAQFIRAYSWTYEDITKETIPDCLQVAQKWADADEDKEGAEAEALAMRKAFDAFDELKMKGGLIRIDGEPVAFTVGEEINPRIFVLHFEKALNGYNGLYAAINQMFAEHHLAQYTYVNREEDLGLEGLRKAKLSYHPSILLEKYVVELKG